jgi:hypothetical protein
LGVVYQIASHKEKYETSQKESLEKNKYFEPAAREEKFVIFSMVGDSSN